jgi:hypothetical protein
VINLWLIFRASGRIIWLAVYIIMLCSCIALVKLLNKRTAIIVLGFSLVLQIYDLSDKLGEIHSNFSGEKEYVTNLQSADFWNDIANNEEIKHIIYASSVNQNFMYSVTDWALKNGKTVNDFYFARSITEKVNQSRDIALEQLSEEDLFIFPETEKAECLKYDLHYYAVDGVIVGYVNEIPGVEEAGAELFNAVWEFGDNQYIDSASGEDTDEGRVIYPCGLSYGPYWPVPVGNYNILIMGYNLTPEVEIIVYSGHGATYHDFDITNWTSETISINLTLNENVEDLEICIRNNSSGNVLLTSIELACADF